jgi:superfamily II DNA or RNA helicase/predicted RNA methylase
MGMVAFVKHPPLHEPSVPQKHAGNYRKRKIAWRGMEISIENEAASMRRGTNRDGKSWEQRMSHPYGYFRGTEGVDGDHVDCFVGPNLDAPTVFVVHARKINRWDEYDEDKVMVGFNSAAEAKQAFLDNYSDPRFFGDMVEMPADEFLTKVKATKDAPAMIKAQQLSLFDAPVMVQASVKKDGTVVKPYVRVQKKAHKPPAETKQTKSETEQPKAVTKPPETETIQPKPETPPPRIADKHPDEPHKFGAQGQSKAERRRINAEVVALVTGGKTEFTPADKALMAKYSGNGGCADSLNEYYTDPDVAEAMWGALRNLGFRSGTALEPSAGTGVFLQTAPAGVKVTGVEIDPISAKVAQHLHGDTHEIQNSSLERFANNDDRQFDVVIGNAPFGDRGATVRDDKPDVARADTYFIDTALDKTAPGGLVAMIVNHGTMDSARDEAMRLRFATKGEFLGAIRMPNTAFEHSHTDVTADIWFFRKRSNEVAGALGTLKRDQLTALGVATPEYLRGDYFEDAGKPNVLGSVEPGWRAKANMGNDITVSGSMQGVPEAIAGFEAETPAPVDMHAILAAVGGDEIAKRRALGASMSRPYEKNNRGDTRTVDGIQYILEGEPLRWHRVDEFMQQQSIIDATPLAEGIERLFRGSAVDRPALEAGIRAYIEKHGLPSKNKMLEQAAHQDRMLYRLIGAVKPDGTLSDAVLGKAATAVMGSLDTAAQTLAAEHEDGLFGVDEIAERAGKSAEDVEDAMMAQSTYAYAGNGKWTTMANYLSGELWPKLDAVKADAARTDLAAGYGAKYALQERKLEEAISPLSLEDVDIAVNYGFIPLDVVAAYFNNLNAKSDASYYRDQKPISLRFANATFYVEGGYFPGKQLLDKYLNRDGVKEDEQPAIDQMNADFKAWLLSSRYRDQVEDLYNRKFRGFVAREFSDATFEIPGMNTEGLKDYQYGGVRWALNNRGGIIAADVGLGKTVRALMLARLAKINGQAKQPVIVVPKSVLSNWAKEAERWFPGSKVLMIGETLDAKGKPKADSAAERNRKLHDMTQNAYDFVFISQPAWNTIDIDPDLKDRYSSEDFWAQRKDQKEGGRESRKRLEAAKMRHEQNVAGKDFQNRSDAADFDKLGIDMLIMDEAHAYKNLFGARNRFGEKPKFLGGGAMSKRALDTTMKARWVRDNNGGRNVYFLTATPSKNSPLEIYSMLSYVAPDSLEQLGIRNSEEFIDRFCEFKNGQILGLDGTIEEALYTSGFKNMDELREIMRRNIDRKTAADVGLKLPEREDFEHVLPMTAQQAAVYTTLREQIENADTEGGAESHIFSVMSRMGKASLDLELLDPAAYAGAESPKYNEVSKIAAANTKDGGQIVFCEAIQSHDKIRAALVKAGIPAEQVVIFNAQTAPTSEDRQRIQDDFNAGKTKVVIGNKTMEEGVNLQMYTADIHHMDTPWEPATLQQRNGRGLRQGNTNAAIRIHSYHSAGTFDGYRYQTVMAKKDWQQLLWNGGNRIENLATPNVPSRDEMLIMLSADPDAERVKMATNKAAAEATYKTAKTTDASNDFIRFQSMKMNLAALKNKETAAGRRLKQNMGLLHAKLKANEHFSQKAALDSETPVLIHPSTGAVVRAGQGVKMKGEQFVVTGVDTKDNEVTLRRWAQVSGRGAMTVKLSDMGAESSVHEHDAAAEEAEVNRQVEADAGAQLEAAKGLKDIAALHSSVIAKNYARLQERLHAGAKDYTATFPYGDVAMIHPSGKVVTASSYAHKDLQDHDYVLPTPEHREKMIRAYGDMERSKKFHMKTDTYGRGRNKSYKTSETMEARYNDSYSTHHNPIGAAGKEIMGANFQEEAHQAFEAEQFEKMQHAKNMDDAMRDAAPTIQVDYNGVKWPKKTLAILFIVAKHTGKLDAPIANQIPNGETVYGRASPLLDRRLFNVRKFHHSESVHGLRTQDALQKLAEANGHYDLAAAIAIQGRPPAEAMTHILDMPLERDGVIDGITHLVEKHPDIASKPVSEFIDSYAIKQKFGHGYETLKMSELPDALRPKEAA